VSVRNLIPDSLRRYTIALLMLTLCPPGHAQSGLVGWWKFDEGSGAVTADSSGYGNTGTLVSSPVWAAGHVGPGALTFNGSTNYVNVPNSSGSLDNLQTTHMTVAAWIKATGTGGGNSGRIIEKGGWFFAMQLSGSSPVVRFTSQDSAGYRNSTPIALNTWVHVAATWDGAGPGSGMHLYVNGVAADDATPVAGNGSTPGADVGSASIGNRASDHARGFPGTIDDVRVYNRILSPAEIQALASGSALTAPTGLLSPAASSNQINLSWTASTDNVPVTGYLIERCAGSGCSSFGQIGTTATPMYFDTGVAPSSTYGYRVRATDANGTSGYSNTVTASTSGTLPYPCVSTGPGTTCYFYDEVGRLKVVQRDDGARLAYTLDAAGNRLATAGLLATALSKPTLSVSPISATSLQLSWSIPTGGNGQLTYVVYRNGQNIRTVGTNSMVDTGLAPYTSYTYTAATSDSQANQSQSDPVTGTTYAYPVISTFSAAPVSSTAIQLTWSATNTNGGGTGLTYTVVRGTTPVSGCNASGCTDTGLQAGTPYTYTLTARNGVDAVTATASGRTYPLPVISVTATAASGTSISLTWSTDDTGGPAGTITYDVMRGSTLLATRTTATSYVDNGLSPNVTYTYTVTAYDSAQDSGTGSASATTSAIPTTPASITTSPLTTSHSAFTVLWAASTGPVASYKLEESVGNSTFSSPTVFTLDASTTSMTFPPGGSSGTFFYFRVSACNSSNQCSAPSATVRIFQCNGTGCIQ